MRLSLSDNLGEGRFGSQSMTFDVRKQVMCQRNAIIITASTGYLLSVTNLTTDTLANLSNRLENYLHKIQLVCYYLARSALLFLSPFARL